MEFLCDLLSLAKQYIFLVQLSMRPDFTRIKKKSIRNAHPYFKEHGAL